MELTVTNRSKALTWSETETDDIDRYAVLKARTKKSVAKPVFLCFWLAFSERFL